MRNKNLNIGIAYLVSLVGALIGWVAFAIGTKYLIDLLQKRYPQKLNKIKVIVLVIVLVVIYASYNYFIVTPLLKR